jgi:hypothetical protein
MRKTCGKLVGGLRMPWVHFVFFSIDTLHAYKICAQKLVKNPHNTHTEAIAFPPPKTTQINLFRTHFSTLSTALITTTTI